MSDCRGCALKKPEKKSATEKVIGIAIKLALAAILLTAAWEQFVKPVLAETPATISVTAAE